MKRAFTLIELLVVIAIIAILAAILFPVFAQAKEAAKKSQCLSNTNQIAKAVQLYATDYDDQIIGWLECSGAATYCVGAPTARPLRVWTGRIQPYVKAGADPATGGGGYPANGPFACPSWTVTALLKGADTTDCDGLPPTSGLDKYFPVNTLNGRQEIYSDYGLAFAMCTPAEANAKNAECLAGGGFIPSGFDYGRDGKTVDNALFSYPGSQQYPVSSGRGKFRSLTEIARPAESTIAGDGGTWVGGGFWNTVFGCEATFMHGTGGNFSFLDGHSKNIRGNPERYRYLGNDGLWIEKYFTMYE